MSTACGECPVRDLAACAALSPEERDALARSGRTRNLRKGETLFHAGEAESTCATLVSGALKVTSTDAEGSERILALIHPAGFVGELFTPFAANDVVALTDSRVCLFARSDLEATVERHPELGLALLRRAQADLHDSRQLLDLTGRRSAAARVSGVLLALARAASESSCHATRRFELPLSRGELAAMLGLTIETVSRQFGELEASGAITKHGSRGVELLDPARLEAIAA